MEKSDIIFCQHRTGTGTEWQDTLLQLCWNHGWRKHGMRRSLHREKNRPRMSDRGVVPDNRAAVSGTRLNLSFLLQVDNTSNSCSFPEAWMFALRPVISHNDARAGRVMSWKEHGPDKTGLSSWALQAWIWWHCKGQSPQSPVLSSAEGEVYILPSQGSYEGQG